jgi:hypothetical protein
MENFTVRDLGVGEEKSVQQIEQELLDKYDAEQQALNQEPIEQEIIEQPVVDLKDEDVLSYIKNRYNKEINSIDDLVAERNAQEELPEDVSAFFKFKKETGRGIDDFVKLNRSYDDADPNELLAEYYSQTEEDLDQDDIAYLLEDKFGYDEDFDDEKVVKKKEMAKKKELAKAKKYFNDLKEQYKAPLESRGGLVPDEEKEMYNAYKEYVQKSQTYQQEAASKSEYFQKKTDEIFSNEFKGFEFDLGDKRLKFSAGDINETRTAQSNVNNFISKFLDENGLIKDAVGYHRALTAAMNPDKLARHFYEQGKSDALLDSARNIKNIDMDVRNAPAPIANTGFQVKSLNDDAGRGLRIKSRK